MGTSYSVKIVDPPAQLRVDALQSLVETELGGLVDRFSTYEPASELARFNASRDTDWVDASDDLVEVLTEARAISELSGGAFDVTVGPLVDLWGFGPEDRGDRVPTDAEVDALRAHVGYANLDMRETPAAIRKHDPDVHVDLSAIAKGYAVDRLATLLESRGIDNYLVEIGGELRGRGRNPAGEHWRIGIEQPVAGERSVHAIIAIDDIGVATSGDYRNYFEDHGQRYSHTIDPRTGRPVIHGLASVTVISPRTLRADALATALMVLGPEAGYALADREGLAALFIVRTADGLVDRQTAAFGKHRLDRST
jgi:thiamine biosynthesis lipoprotein